MVDLPWDSSGASDSAVSSDSFTRLAAALENGGNSDPAPGTETALIRSADELIRLSEARLQHLVVTARRRGVSWQAIGQTLGVSRQAAFKRFSGTLTSAGEGDSVAQPAVDLIDRTVEIFRRLADGDDAAVRSLMTYTCSRALTKRKLASVWKAVIAESGRLEDCADSTVQTPDGRTSLEKLANRHLLSGAVVQTTLRHEAGEWIGRVAFNGSGKVTGMLIAPPGSQNLTF